MAKPPAAMNAARAGFDKQIRWALPRVKAAECLIGDADARPANPSW